MYPFVKHYIFVTSTSIARGRHVNRAHPPLPPIFFLKNNQTPEPKLRTGPADNVDHDECSYNWYHHNTFRTYGNECIDVKEGSHHNLIENNVCEQQLDENSGGFDLRGDENTVRYNEIAECIGAGVRVGGDQDFGAGNNIYGNVIQNMGAGAFNVLKPGQGAVCENIISGSVSVSCLLKLS